MVALELNLKRGRKKTPGSKDSSTSGLSPRGHPNHHVCMWGMGQSSCVGGAWPALTAFRCQSTSFSIYPSCDHKQLFNSFLHCFSVCKTGIIVAPTSPGIGGLHMRGSTCTWLMPVAQCHRGPTHLHVKYFCQWPRTEN